MQGYVKLFADGSRECLSDEDVRQRKASWRHGRLEGLIGVYLCHNSICVSLITGEGEWWQSDTMISVRSPITQQSEFFARRIERRIAPEDIGKFIVMNHNCRNNIHSIKLDAYPSGSTNIGIEDKDIGKWIFVTLYPPHKVEISVELNRV